MSALQWFNVLCDSLLVVDVLVTAVLMFGWIRVRHDGSLFWVFLLFGVALASFGIYHGLVITIWLTNPFAGDNHWWFTALILAKGLCVLTWTPTVILLLWVTPRVMRVPSVKHLAEKCVEMRQELRQLHNTIAEMVSKKQLDTHAASEKLADTHLSIKGLREELEAIKKTGGT